MRTASFRWPLVAMGVESHRNRDEQSLQPMGLD